ncbi:MAG TPA: GGDEF domain-containing protein [Bryobacteraceae bacterium]
MISFRRLIDLEKDDLAASLLRVILLFLEASALHAIDYDSEEQSTYQREIREIRDKFEHAVAQHDILILAGEANQSIQAYNRGVEKFIRSLSAEKQAIVNLMGEALLRVCSSSERAGENLRRIEKQLEKAVHLEDIRSLKSKLSECLDVLCREAERQEAQAREVKSQLAEPGNAIGPADHVTGLPGLRHAERYVRELAHAGTHAYAAPFFLKSLQVINRRFGYTTGDQILLRYSQHLTHHLGDKDRLFRWRGPCFVAILERFQEPDVVRSEVLHIASLGLEHSVESGDRSMLFKISTAWDLIPIPVGSGVAEISRKIDAFAAEQTGAL